MTRAIPHIDLAAADAPRDIDRACREIGFLVIGNHGVPAPVIEAAFAAARSFFRLSDEEKLRSAAPDRRIRGYLPPGQQALARSRGDESPPDLLERFRMGRFDVPDDAYHRDRASSWFVPNLWPAEPRHFAGALQAYFASMEALAGRLMRLFALALGLPPGFFDDKIDRHISNMYINYYPAQPNPPQPGQLRAGAHTDYGSLTILAPSEAFEAGRGLQATSGLQVRAPSGEWHDVAPPPGTFVVNIGDLMAQWTNDRWVSTLHRVVNPPRAAARADRMSLVFFHQPNDDALIECLPSCCADNAPKYAPVTSGEHQARKLRRTFEKPAA
jgi:isopenicillin N synthase-like dioxygenase